MKKDITIKIPDNLSDKEEIVAIAKQLAQKQISGGGQNKSIKRLGNEMNIVDLKTTITIERISAEKPIVMLKCNVCDCEYQSDMAKNYYNNYGGIRKKRSVCSDNYLQFMLDNFGDRIQKSARKLPPAVNYFTRPNI